MLDAGVFFTLLAIGFVFLIAKIQYREFFQFFSATIFYVLGMMVISGQDMAFFTIINDGVNPINQTNYFIGNGTAQYSISSIGLGTFLILMGVVSTFVAILSWFSFKGNNKP